MWLCFHKPVINFIALNVLIIHFEVEKFIHENLSSLERLPVHSLKSV